MPAPWPDLHPPYEGQQGNLITLGSLPAPLLTQQRLDSEVPCPLSPADCVQSLKEVVKELLVEFVRANSGMKPARIIFFRDGVSEGEFLKVIRPSCLPLHLKSQHLLHWGNMYK